MIRSMTPTLTTFILIFLNLVVFNESCTNILVTPSTTTDGSSYIAYNADSPQLFGTLYHYPYSNNNPDDQTRDIYEWDTGNFLGTIPEAKSTYNVVGNTNCQGLIIGETTFGGVDILKSQDDAIIDYGSLIYLTLQRAKTCREAIKTMVELMDTYGYASRGESFSLADATTKEVWMMEVIGRGNTGKKGAVWVAQRIPDGHVASHANQARITTFDQRDYENCLYAADVIDLARSLGLYSGSDEDFSFSDTYDPLDFHGVRYGEARVWSIFSRISENPNEFREQYLDYVNGQNMTNRMPLYIKPKNKLSLQDLSDLMADRYEDTELDSSLDVSGGMFHTAFRPYPTEWEYQKNQYFNERTVAIPKTGWGFIGQIRFNVTKELASILWFAADESSTSPRLPVYGSCQAIPTAFEGDAPQDGHKQPILKFDLTKAFWVQNLVANFAYSRWSDAYPFIQEKLKSIQHQLQQEIHQVDRTAMLLSQHEAIDHVTAYSLKAGKDLHEEWMAFFGDLFARFRDGYTIIKDENQASCGCQAQENGFDETWKKIVVDGTGDRYKVPETHGKNKNKATIM